MSTSAWRYAVLCGSFLMCVLSSSVATAEVITLACTGARNGAVNPVINYLAIDTSASTVKGPDDKTHPAQISNTTISYSYRQSNGEFSWQIDRLSGRLTMIESSGRRTDFDCRRTQGF